MQKLIAEGFYRGVLACLGILQTHDNWKAALEIIHSTGGTEELYKISDNGLDNDTLKWIEKIK